MIFGNDRDQLRQMYLDSWTKFGNGQPMTPLERQIAAVIALHPEYHSLLNTTALTAEFTPEQGASNPFLHMGLHLAIRDQTATDRPPGIRQEFQRVLKLEPDEHTAEHRLIDCLAESLWEAGRRQQPPDEQQYLERIKRLA